MSSPTLWKTFVAGLPAGCTIAVMCLTWVTMSEAIQGLEDGWAKPWFVTYVIHSGYALMLIPWIFLRYRRTKRWFWFKSSVHNKADETASMEEFPVSEKQLLTLALIMQVWSAASGFTWYISLQGTIASANMAIYQSASAFVFVISVFTIGEAVTVPKLLAVGVCIAGVCTVSFAPSSASSDSNVQSTAVGYMWVVVSTVLYSGYQVVYSHFTEYQFHGWRELCSRSRQRGASAIGEAEDRSTLLENGEVRPVAAVETQESPAVSTPEVKPQLSNLLTAEMSSFMLGWMGVFCFVTLWPLFFIFDASGVEPFVWPDSHKAELLAGSTILDAVYNVALLFGIQITSPLWMSLGTVLVVPAGIFADKIFKNVNLNAQIGGGIALILLGFMILQVPLPAWMNRRLPCPCARRAK